jgi:aminoglycoside 3-N-acetyltransferase
MVHSSLSSLGTVEGGADTVVDALLEVVGQGGTLVVPTFTFVDRHGPEAIVDPQRDPSTVGRITEVARRRPEALRTIHPMHMVSALGRQAKFITDVDPTVSSFAEGGSFWRIMEAGAKILMLGVPYLRCTAFHLFEFHAQVPYRTLEPVSVQVRRADGSLQRVQAVLFVPHWPFQGSPGNDFNRLGNVLEERRLVRIGAVGNAMARAFPLKEAFQVGVALGRDDPTIFCQTGGEWATLKDGVAIGEWSVQKSVVDPAKVYGGGQGAR